MKTKNKLLRVLLDRHEKTASSSQTQPYQVNSKAVNRALLLSDEAFASALFLIVMDDYGEEALQWAPETIRRELEDDYRLELPKETLDKIMAAITVVTTNFFYKDVARFVELCNIFAGDDFQPDEFDPADADEILLGITEALFLWPPDDSEESQFSEEIREYISQVLGEEGVVKPFDMLRLALDGDQSDRVDSEYADDPEMYSAIYGAQTAKTDEMQETYLENVGALMQQLSLLRLKEGKTEAAVQQLQQIVSGAVGAP
jgi:hypothetical protein